jgi:predicted MFS family arabinose efflux permease
MVGPLLGILADRYGRRKIMATGLMCQAIGATGLALVWQWWAILPAIFLGIAIPAFLPAQQAYISDKVAYHHRGRALGIIEFSWATAGIVSLPVIGWMIDSFGWRSPLLLLGLFSLAGALAIWFFLPAVEHRSQVNLNRAQFLALLARPNILASIGVALFLFVTVSIFITIWSIWLSADFGLSATALGWVGTGIGLAELSGSGMSSLFIDKLGKRRGSLLGLFLGAVFFLLLPLTQDSLFLAVPGLILLGLMIEFSIVSLLPLYSEQAPEARATIFSLVALGISIGSAAGSPVAAILWERIGLGAVGAVGAASLLVAMGLTWRFLHE